MISRPRVHRSVRVERSTETTATKTPGQVAYEADVVACPIFHDGGRRPAWEGLDPVVQQSWERNPTPRPGMAETYAAFLAHVAREE